MISAPPPPKKSPPPLLCILNVMIPLNLKEILSKVHDPKLLSFSMYNIVIISHIYP